MVDGKEKQFVFETVERNREAIALLCEEYFLFRRARHAGV
jgi:hypothetical protein